LKSLSPHHSLQLLPPLLLLPPPPLRPLPLRPPLQPLPFRPLPLQFSRLCSLLEDWEVSLSIPLALALAIALDLASHTTLEDWLSSRTLALHCTASTALMQSLLSFPPSRQHCLQRNVLSPCVHAASFTAMHIHCRQQCLELAGLPATHDTSGSAGSLHLCGVYPRCGADGQQRCPLCLQLRRLDLPVALCSHAADSVFGRSLASHALGSALLCGTCAGSVELGSAIDGTQPSPSYDMPLTRATDPPSLPDVPLAHRSQARSSLLVEGFCGHPPLWAATTSRAA